MTDAGRLLEDHDAGAMTVAVPGTQQGPGCHPSRPQRVAGLLFQVLRVVVHSHVVAGIPAESSIAVSNQELHYGIIQGKTKSSSSWSWSRVSSPVVSAQLGGMQHSKFSTCRLYAHTEPGSAPVSLDADCFLDMGMA